MRAAVQADGANGRGPGDGHRTHTSGARRFARLLDCRGTEWSTGCSNNIADCTAIRPLRYRPLETDGHLRYTIKEGIQEIDQTASKKEGEQIEGHRQRKIWEAVLLDLCSTVISRGRRMISTATGR